MAYSVELDSVACIGCVACTRCEYFEMRQDMKAHAVQSVVVEIGCIREMAENCPVSAIVYRDIPSTYYEKATHYYIGCHHRKVER